jgi:hypothetical protein
MFLGLSYRHLSQDETETAERGKYVATTGLPLVITPTGEVSVFAGGREIEDGHLHRYTPWGQFYAAGLGVLIGRMTGMNQDGAVRLPFVAAHAATSGLISYGMSACMPVPAAVTLGALYAFQTDRILHNRTARYHALMDLFVVIGWLAIAGLRTKRKWAAPMLAGVIFLLPHIHTIAGSLISLFFGLIGAILIYFEDQPLADRARKIFWTCILPGMVSLVCLLALTRPWAQSLWGDTRALSYARSYYIHRRFVYAYLFLGVSGLMLSVRGEKRGFALLGCFMLLMIIVPQLDRNQNAQFRYYLPVWAFSMLWPIGYGLENVGRKTRNVFIFLLFALIILPEVSTRRYHPYHGLELIIDDVRKERRSTKQPLHEIIDSIRQKGKVGDSILFDSVPMYANWYFPGFHVALMPDETQRHKLNNSNSIWSQPLTMPDWHIWYPNWRSGIAAILESDYRAYDLDMNTGRYMLTSKKLGQTRAMCIERYWRTNIFNNNALHLYNDDSLIPSGGYKDVLVLARPCGEK